MLAAYQPNEELFRRQLLSIANQTHSDFTCLVTCDGDSQRIAQLVESTLPGDDRFRILGFDDRLGYYKNFERGLSYVEPNASWVALSDQDDYWYPGKLEKLLPFLRDHLLVSGQARVVTDSGQILAPSTARRTVSLQQLVIQNQVTGGLSVFRRELLDLALPFPELNVLTQNHDHWLAVCACSIARILILDEVVQDYVQHGANVIGEAMNRFNPVRSIRRALELSRLYEGGAGPIKILNMISRMTFGWALKMLTDVESRVSIRTPEFQLAMNTFGSSTSGNRILRPLFDGLCNRDVHYGMAVTWFVGIARAAAVKEKLMEKRSESR